MSRCDAVVLYTLRRDRGSVTSIARGSALGLASDLVRRRPPSRAVWPRARHRRGAPGRAELRRAPMRPDRRGSLVRGRIRRDRYGCPPRGHPRPARTGGHRPRQPAGAADPPHDRARGRRRTYRADSCGRCHLARGALHVGRRHRRRRSAAPRVRRCPPTSTRASPGRALPGPPRGAQRRPRRCAHGARRDSPGPPVRRAHPSSWTTVFTPAPWVSPSRRSERGSALADEEIGEGGARLARACAGRAGTHELDLVLGASGRIVAMLTLRAQIGGDTAIDAALVTAGELVARAAEVRLTGLSHGMSGAGLALLELGAATGEPEPRDAGRRC